MRQRGKGRRRFDGTSWYRRGDRPGRSTGVVLFVEVLVLLLLLTLGMSISSVPLSNFALTSSALASRGRRMARVTVP